MTAPSSSTSPAAVIAPDTIAELRALLAKATPGPWQHYDEVFRSQFSRRRVTEIQRSDYKAIIAWSGFDGLPDVTARKKNANAALIVAAVNALPDLLTAAARGVESEAEIARLRQILRTLVLQREAHFHTVAAWDDARHAALLPPAGDPS